MDKLIKVGNPAILNINRMISEYGSLTKFAYAIDCPLASLHRYISNRKFPYYILDNICNKYDLQLRQLLNRDLDGDYKNFRLLYTEYWAYFFTTGDTTTIDAAKLQMKNGNVSFEIISKSRKVFLGTYSIDSGYLYFELYSATEGISSHAYITMSHMTNIRYPQKYIGGLGLLLLPSDSSRWPCAQRIILSHYELARRKDHPDNQFLKDHLEIEPNKKHNKVTNNDDTSVLNYLKAKTINQ